MKKGFKVILIISIILFAAFLIALVSFMYTSNTASIHETYIHKVLLDDNILHVSGDFSSSASVYKNYSYWIQDDCLYLCIKKGFPTSGYRSGAFSIQIQDDLTNIKSVFLVDDQNNKILIWGKNSEKKQ